MKNSKKYVNYTNNFVFDYEGYPDNWYGDPTPWMCAGVENAGKILVVDERGLLTKFIDIPGGGETAIDTIELNGNELDITNKKVNINAATSIIIDDQTATVDNNGNIDLTNLIPSPSPAGSKVMELTNGVLNYEYSILIPTLTVEQFTSILTDNYNVLHLQTTLGGTQFDNRYTILFTRDGKNSSLPTLNDTITIHENNCFITYNIDNNQVVYSIYHIENNTPIIPIVEDTSYNNTQFCRKQVGGVKKLVLSYELVPELVDYGYQYSYADIFSWDNHSLICNDSLFRPLVSGWSSAFLVQNWNKRINDPAASGTQVGQLNTGSWPGMVINEVVILNSTFAGFFKEWEQGDTGTPIWVRYDSNGNLLELSFTEIQDTSTDIALFYKDSSNNEHRIAEYDWKDELMKEPLQISFNDVFNSNSVWSFNSQNLIDYKVKIYSLQKLEFQGYSNNSVSQTSTGWKSACSINSTFNVNYEDKNNVTHILTFKPRIKTTGTKDRGFCSLYVSTTSLQKLQQKLVDEQDLLTQEQITNINNKIKQLQEGKATNDTTSKYCLSAIDINLSTNLLRQYYTTEMINQTGGTNIYLSFDVELVSAT